MQETQQRRTSAQVAADNDDFRRSTMGIFSNHGGQVAYSAGVAQLIDDDSKAGFAVVAAVHRDNVFEPGNDPYAEHDFGKVTQAGVDYFWKIDYYENRECQHGGDPYAGDVYRVLTIMRADEY